jgi:NhaP-type Na+/H+ or K+/H+ antiporter
MDLILSTIVVATAVGIGAQIIADRFQLPAILPLLVLGILLGPAGIGLFEPHSLGGVLEVAIHLGVAIILFEGGLSLEADRLLKVGAPVRNLLTIGVVVTGLGCAALAHGLLGLSWGASALFGAIMTVTGPTVIVPLLRHMIAPKAVKTILLSEGLIIDPIGAVLAYIVLQWIVRAGIPARELGGDLLLLVASGTILGFAAGALARLVLRTRLVGGELRNLSVLALLLLCYVVSERQAHQSGILAAVVMGFTLSASELPDLVSLKAFKGQLTTLIISVLFVLLAGQLRLESIFGLGWQSLLVVAGIVLVVRPLSVLLSVHPSHLPWRGRTVVALTAPRGIVAAAVASLAAREMETLGISGAGTLEGLVYLTIMVTGAWATVVALVVPWLLGYTSDPARRRVVLVGANALSEQIALLLQRAQRTTVVVDAASWRLDRFRDMGIMTVCGDAREAATYEDAGVERDSTVVALTTNDELNLLVAELVRDEFGVEHPIVALQRPPEDLGRRSRAWVDLLGGGSIDVPGWVRMLENEEASLLELDSTDEASLPHLREVEREHRRRILRLGTWVGDQLRLAVDDDAVKGADRLAVLLGEGRAMELLRPHVVVEGTQEEVPLIPGAAADGISVE